MAYMDLIGVAGLVLIVIGWCMGLRSIPPIELSSLYTCGSLLLTVYAILRHDVIFTVLNLLATLIATLNIVRAFRLRRTARVVKRQ